MSSCGNAHRFNQLGFSSAGLRAALVSRGASAICVSLLLNSAALSATTALEPWKQHGKDASRAFADNDLPEAERLLKRALELAEQEGVIDERAVNLKNSLAEVLVKEKKYEEAKRVYQSCRLRIKALNLENEPIAIRTERSRSMLLDDLGSPDERIAVHKEVLALTRKICGPDSDPYKFVLSETYSLAVAFNRADEALKLRAELDGILEHQPTANADVFSRDVEFAGRMIMASPDQSDVLSKAMALLENSERKASRFRENRTLDYFGLYRYLTIGYRLSSKRTELRKASQLLVDEIPNNSLWPDPRLRSILGSAYYGLAGSCDPAKPAMQIEYLCKSISNFSLAPKEDSIASGYKFWAETALVDCLARTGKLDEGEVLLSNLKLEEAKGFSLNVEICQSMVTLAAAYVNSTNNANKAKAIALCDQAIAFLSSKAPPPNCSERCKTVLQQGRQLKAKLL